MALRIRVLGSGSSGNATLIESASSRVLIDAGLGPRQLAERLLSAGVDPASLDAVLISHEHHDHAKGAASFSAKWGVRLCGSRGTYAAAGFGAVEIAGYDVFEPDSTRQFGRLTVRAVPVPHDAAGPLAFVVADAETSFGHATDLGQIDARLSAAFAACDGLLIEANYDPALLRDGPYPWSLKDRILGPSGHLANGDVARYITQALAPNCQTLVLAHLSRKNNHPELVRMACEPALVRAGRAHVRLELTNPEGTGWLDVAPKAVKPQARQLALF